LIALDTNILVYAHRPESPFHKTAFELLRSLVASGERYAIPFHCLVEFCGVVRHPRVWKHPSSVEQVRAQVEAWLEPPTARLLTEEEKGLELFLDLIEAGSVSGGGVHDARIVACCSFHGVKELWSADRDFSRYDAVRVRNPLVSS